MTMPYWWSKAILKSDLFYGTVHHTTKYLGPYLLSFELEEIDCSSSKLYFEQSIQEWNLN